MKRATLAAAAALLVGLALPAAALAWNGKYPAGDALGSTVSIEVSSAYPVDPTLPQGWATFLGTLLHGRELSRLTLRLAPLDEVQGICGGEALACYDPRSETIVASPEDQLGTASAREVLTHEYGHHVANNSVNAPFSAEAYGTKRWASYMNICKRTAAGELFPGDESARYQENPGEAYAEAYRVLNLTRQGTAQIGWEIVDRSLYPDATALTLLQADIATPWLRPSLTRVRGAFGNGSVRTISMKTPLDGSYTARLTAPSSSRMRLSLYAGGRLVAQGRTVRLAICGQRSLTLKVERLAGRGAFSVDVTKP